MIKANEWFGKRHDYALKNVGSTTYALFEERVAFRKGYDKSRLIGHPFSLMAKV